MTQLTDVTLYCKSPFYHIAQERGGCTTAVHISGDISLDGDTALDLQIPHHATCKYRKTGTVTNVYF